MPHKPFIILFLAVFLIITLHSVAQEIEGFEIRQLTDNIFVFIGKEAGTDQLVIRSEKGLVAVDTHWSNITAAGFRKAFTDYFNRDDFVFTINSVDRLDMFGGNETYKDSIIVGHESFKNQFTEEAVAAEINQLIEMWRWKEEVSRERLKTHEPGSERAKGEERWMLTCKRRADELEQGFSFKLPDIFYKDRMKVDLGNMNIELIYFGKAGRDGISIIVVPEEKAVIFTGFILHTSHHLAPHPQPEYAELDVQRWIAVMKEVLVENENIEKVIADTRQVWTKERALTHLNYIETLWNTVKKAEAEGMTLKQVQKLCSMDEAFSFVKEMHPYLKHGDDWIRPQHVAHMTTFYWQHKNMACQKIRKVLQKKGLEAAKAKFEELFAQKDKYYFDELSFNGIGYFLLSSNYIPEAIEIFKMNVIVHPESANVYDSLGEAYHKNGDKEFAIKNYKKSLALNPENENARKILKELGAEL